MANFDIRRIMPFSTRSEIGARAVHQTFVLPFNLHIVLITFTSLIYWQQLDLNMDYVL